MKVYGSSDNPVRLDPFQTITEVHWPAAGGGLVLVWFDNGEKSGKPYLQAEIIEAKKKVDGVETAFTLPTDKIGERALFGPGPDSYWLYAALEQAGLKVLEWGGVRDQWIAEESTEYASFGEQQLVLRLDNIETIAETPNFKVRIQCRWGISNSPPGDGNPGTSRLVAKLYEDGEATWINPDLDERLVNPSESFDVTGTISEQDQINGLTLTQISTDGLSQGDFFASSSPIVGVVTYDALDGTATVTVDLA